MTMIHPIFRGAATALLALALLTGCERDAILLPAPEAAMQGEALHPYSISSRTGDNQFTDVYSSTTVELTVALPYSRCEAEIVPPEAGEVGNLTEKLEKYTHLGSFTLLPESNRTLAWEAESDDPLTKRLTVTLAGIEELDYGYYVLPIHLRAGGCRMSHYILVHHLGDVVPLDHRSKALPPDLLGGPERTEPMKMVAYVETNNYDIRNYGNLILRGSRLPVFDFVVLFAANMNYDAVRGKRYISFNDKLQPIVNHPEIYIKPLTDRGIKVIIDILPNHQGVGYLNFQDYDDALDFAREAKMWTDKLGIDGWDIDEEYAEYGKAPLPRTERSALMMAKAFKEVMPDKLLTHYEFNSPFGRGEKDDDGKTAIDYLDYCWSNYGVTADSFLGMPHPRYGNRSIEGNRAWAVAGAGDVARANVRNGMGLMMLFNLNPARLADGSQLGYLSDATRVLYGEECDFVGPLYEGPAK